MIALKLVNMGLDNNQCQYQIYIFLRVGPDGLSGYLISVQFYTLQSGNKLSELETPYTGYTVQP